jgi:VacB/RNase II family 3'-5' exoribonuclease
MNATNGQDRARLDRIARAAMIARGLLPDFSVAARYELGGIHAAAAEGDGEIRDLRNLLWASIDNDDSRDLDQLTVAEALPGGRTKIRVAVADVDALVKNGTAIDEHARHNTTSVYTAATIFPMLPEKLSTDMTSLNPHEDRLAVVVEMTVGPDGALLGSSIYRARVRNRAKLAYNAVAAWLEDGETMPPAVAALPGLDENIRLQDRVAQQMKNLRQEHGALNLETIQARPIFEGDAVRKLEVEKPNRAKELIADFMIAANGATTRFLVEKNLPTLRRVVRTPRRWEAIVEIARQRGFELPEQPNPQPLEAFLMKEQAADPLRFPDLSLTIIKLLGNGEYVAEFPGENAALGHFGLAVRDYSHSTAPNRRYPDIITQRLLKAAMCDRPAPYDKGEMELLAKHCSKQEDAAKKVERQVGKSAAALLLESKIGAAFDALVTGASPKGTYIRLLDPPVEGKLVQGTEGLDVGRQIRVQLLRTDVEQGYIDFKKIS